MASTKITTEQFAKYMGRLGDRWRPTILRGVAAGAMRTIPLLMKRTQEAPRASPGGMPGAFDTGRYHAGWRSGPIPNGANVFNVQPYSGIIDYGRRPAPVGREGIRNLEAWARRKLKLNPKEARAAAFAIAKTLKERGLNARKVMSGATNEMTELVEKEILHELDVEVKR